MIDTTKMHTLFKQRLRELRGNRTLKEVADSLGISRATLGFYEDGSRKPDIEILYKIAKYYNVSADYLLGISDTPSTDQDIKTLSDNFGINLQNAINLNYWKKQNIDDSIRYRYILEDLNWLIDSELLDLISSYLHFKATHFYSLDDKKETFKPIEDLEFYDSELNTSYGNDYDYLSQAMLVKIQQILTAQREENLQKMFKELITTQQSYDALNPHKKAAKKKDDK